MTISVANTAPCPSESHSPRDKSIPLNVPKNLETCTAALSLDNNTAKKTTAAATSSNTTNSITITAAASASHFAIQPNPLHGCLAAYATHFIPRHTVILVEPPHLCGEDIDSLTRLHEEGIHASRADDEAFLRDHVGLDDEQCRRIWELHDQFAEVSEINPANDDKRLLGIVKTNAYLSTDMGGLGLYPIISRFDHSCVPNVGYGFDGWNMRLYTTRDVQKGEELNTCYSDMVYFHNREMRRVYLKAKFNFDCVCRGCNPPASSSPYCGDHVGETDEDIKENKCHGENTPVQQQQQQVTAEETIRKSDDRRSRLKFLSQMLSIRNDGQIKRGHLQMILESLRLLREERLEHNLGPTYRIAYEWAKKLEEMGSMDDALVEEVERSVGVSGRDAGGGVLDALGEECLRIMEVSLGADHAQTRAFQRKLSEAQVR